LEHSYIPEKLPTRENIRREISASVERFLNISSRGFWSVHIYGNVGTGKTVLSRRIAKDITDRNNDILTCYVNCRFSRRIYRVLADIAKQISDELPTRGLSKDEFLDLIFVVAKEKASSIILILDEIDSLFWGEEGKKTADILYSFSRFAERKMDLDLRIAVISISRNQDYIYKWLDAATRASFIKSTKYLSQYSSKDLFKILKYRSSLAIHPDAINEETLRFIATFVGNQAQGNARIAIDLLKMAGEIAEAQGDEQIRPEHIRIAIKEYAIIPSVDIESILALGKQKLILLLAIIRALKQTKRSFVTKNMVQEYYEEICHEYNETPRRYIQTWRYLREMEHELCGILELHVTGKNQKGRSTRILINAPLDDLERNIVAIIKRKYQT